MNLQNLLHYRGTTIASVALSNQGLQLYCALCKNYRTWSPAQLAAAEPPTRSLWGFKRRRHCSKCKVSASIAWIYLTRYEIISAPDRWPTPPQLWPP